MLESAMNAITPSRIIELWPSLSQASREKLIAIAETIADTDTPLELSPGEEHLLAQARDDFKHGRTISLDGFKADLDGFFDDLRARSKA